MHRRPDHDRVTTAPGQGQPAAAFPVAPPGGRAGLLAVPAVVVIVALVVGGLRSLPTALGPVLAGAGLALLVSFQTRLWSRQRRLTDDLQRSQSSFRTLAAGARDVRTAPPDAVVPAAEAPGIRS
jgi:hypothetical protein